MKRIRGWKLRISRGGSSPLVLFGCIIVLIAWFAIHKVEQAFDLFPSMNSEGKLCPPNSYNDFYMEERIYYIKTWLWYHYGTRWGVVFLVAAGLRFIWEIYSPRWPWWAKVLFLVFAVILLKYVEYKMLSSTWTFELFLQYSAGIEWWKKHDPSAPHNAGKTDAEILKEYWERKRREKKK